MYPRYSNTGVLNTGSKMYGNSENLDNSLTASVDWIAFTSTIIPDMKEMAEFLGYRESDFLLLPRGANGYKKMYRLEGFPVTVLTDGSENMGVHVVVGSSAIADLLEHFKNSITFNIPFAQDVLSLSDFDNTVMLEFLAQVRNIGWFTRFDLAVDDFGARFFTVEDVRDFLDRQDVVSKFRTWRDVCESSFAGEKTGHTLYFGSRQSEIMLRVYDKRLEQLRKAVSPADAGPEDASPENGSGAWVRWELELKNARADAAVELLLARKQIGEIFMGILDNYVRLILPDDSNRSRCSSHPLWKAFTGAVGKLRLFVREAQKTIEDKKRWLVRQCLPTLAGVIIADGGSLDIITQHFDDAVSRMSSSLRHLVSGKNPGWLRDYETLPA